MAKQDRNRNPRSRNSVTRRSRRSADTPRGLVKPSAAAQRRIESIPMLFNNDVRPHEIAGRVVFDSWAHGPAMGLRDATDGHVRRLRLKAGNTSLEILAERNRANWSFVARVYQGRNVTHDFVLKIGGRKLLAGTGGFYQWTSTRVPRQLALLSYESLVCFDEVKWS